MDDTLSLNYFKCHLGEGCYYKFMSWMSNCLYGRPNLCALVVHSSDADATNELFQKILPGCRTQKRINSLRQYEDNVIMYVNTHPRTFRQKMCIQDTMQHSNVMFINPANCFTSHTTIPILMIDLVLTPTLQANHKDVALFMHKFYMLSTFRPFLMHTFFSKSPHCDMQGFTEFRNRLKHDPNVRTNMHIRECVANSKMLMGKVDLDYKKRNIEINDPLLEPLGPLNMLHFVLAKYDNAIAMLSWLVRCAMGLVSKSVVCIHDPTNTTLFLLSAMCKHLKTAMFSDVNIKNLYTMTNIQDHDLFVFRHLTLPLIDLDMLTNHTNCAIISKTNVAFHTHTGINMIYARFNGTETYNFHPSSNVGTLIREWYDLTVKEPNYIPFAEQSIEKGNILFNSENDISKLIEDYATWCQHLKIPIYHYNRIVSPTNLYNTFCLILSTFFRCSWNEKTIIIHSKRKRF